MRRRKARQRHGLFVAEGVRTVEELLAAGLPVRGALASPALDATDRGASLRRSLAAAGVAVLDVSDADFASAADTDTPQGVLAVAEPPRGDVGAIVAATAHGGRALVLDGVQDPGNAGTMLRAAAAFGAAGVLALPGTVDLWSAKVVRSAMGALFRVPVVHLGWEELVAAAVDLTLWGADAGGEPVGAIGDAPRRLAVVVGNEGAGLSGEARERVHRLVSIPIAPTVESLNAAVAAGILLYELRPPRLR